MWKTSGSKYGTLLSLYLAQSIPMSFFSTVMPVLLRGEQYSLTSIGFLQLIKLPWIIKFLWAPFVDKTGATIHGHRKWIIFSEIFYAIVIFSISFLSLDINFKLVITLMVIAITASATQDIATDAFAILILRKKERSIGNSMQSAGSFLGTLTGSGVLLMIYDDMGWQPLLACLAGFVLLAIIPVIFYKGKKDIPERKPSPPIQVSDIWRFFTAKENLRRIILLAIFYSGITGILSMSAPWMVDLKYTKSEIGLLKGIYGAASGAGAALIAGYIVKRIKKLRSLQLFILFAIISASYFYYLTQADPDRTMIIIGMLLIWATYGMCSVIIYTISMDNVRPGREGTDFTIQIVITHLSGILVVIGSGKIADLFGYNGLFLTETFVCLLVFLLIPYLYREKKEMIKTT